MNDSQLMNYLKLIRPLNLIFLAFTQFILQRAVIDPILQVYGFSDYSSGMYLFLLIISTVLIAAGGYILNDYFDIKIDSINQPDKVIISRYMSKKAAMIFYQVMTFTGVLAGLILSYWVRSFTLAFIFIMVPGLLWFYSSNYKRQFMIGNLVVSFNTALSILVLAIAQVALFHTQYGNLIYETPIPRNIYSMICGFSLFAFLLTWIREIIKDLEDEQGDREMECRTMAIKWGAKKTKLFIYFLIALVIIALFIVNSLYIPFEGTLTFRYFLFGLVIPLLILIYMVKRAESPTMYHQASSLSKFIMLIGVLYSFIFYFLQAKTYGISIFGLFVV